MNSSIQLYHHRNFLHLLYFRILVYIIVMISMCGAKHLSSDTNFNASLVCDNDHDWKKTENRTIDYSKNKINNDVLISNAANNLTWYSDSRENFAKALVTCGLTSLVLLSDDPFFQTFVLKSIGLSDIPLILYYDIRNTDNGHGVARNLTRLDQFIRRFYIQNEQKNFVIATENPSELLSQIEALFLEETYGEIALLPHRTNWIVILWTERQWEELVAQQYRSVFDNVVAIKVRNTTPSSSLCEIKGISTFMWRQNRTREPINIKLSTADPKQCALFPNQKFGLNGRMFIVGAKVFLNLFLNVDTSPIDGKEEVKGFLRDVLDFSSSQSNYTYTLEVSKYKFANHGIDWEEYTSYLLNGSMDISLCTWSPLNRNIYKISFSYPVAFDAIVGIYRRPSHDGIYNNSWVFLCPFPPLIYLFLLTCAIYTSLLYSTIAVYWDSDLSRPPDMKFKSKDSFWVDRFLSELGAEENSNSKRNSGVRVSFGGKVLTVLLYYLPKLSSFFAAILNQSYLPRPHQLSARTVVGVWAVGMVFFYAIFSSSITAEMVMPRGDLPFKTFNEFLNQNEYTSTVLNESVLDYSMEFAAKGTPLEKLRAKTKIAVLHADKDEPIDLYLADYLENLDHNIVFFHYESALQMWLQGNAHADNYVIMSNDPVFNSDISIGFPFKSELKEVVSNDIHRILESGFQTKFLAGYSTNLTASSKRDDLPSKIKKHEMVKVVHLFWTFILCLIGLSLSLVSLGLEIFLSRLMWDGKNTGLRMLIPVDKLLYS